MMSIMKHLNIVLFGASGYTGQVTIPALSTLTKTDGRTLTWGIAGRSREKLKRVLQTVGKDLDKDFSNIPIIVADTLDEGSLNHMCAQAQLVINVSGPFRFLGEPVVKACLANNTHYIDITGEPQFMEMIQLKYSEEAKKQKCYIVSSCGFDSIPADLGVVFMQQNFRGVLDSIEAHMVVSTASKTPMKGPSFNYATWVSAVNGFEDYESLKMIRRQLNERRIKVPPKRKADKKKSIFKNDITGQWSLPFPAADPSVVKRSQQYFYEYEDKHPIKFDMYFNVDSVSTIIGAFFTYASLSILSRSKFGKELLLKHPKFFSLGVLQKGAPLEEDRKQSLVTIHMKGNGCLDANKDRHKNQPNDTIFSRISTQDPGYGSTGVIVTLAAITLLEEHEKLPNNGNGGVFTPAAVFSKTSLLQKLNNNGVIFQIVSKY